MKTRVIRRALKQKLDDWAKTITDPEVRKAARENAIIAGGSIASMLLGEKISDFDVYFETSGVAGKVAQYYVDQFLAAHSTRHETQVGRTEEIAVEEIDGRVKIKVRSKGMASASESTADYQFFEDPSIGTLAVDDYIDQTVAIRLADEEMHKGRFEPVFMTTNAITLSDRMQLVVRFCGTPDEVLQSFDFAHCMNYYRAKDNTLVLHPEALECLLVKELRYKGSLYPLCSVIRTRKFIKRGFTCHAGDYLKMLWQVSELDLSNMHVLEEQLTGVDAAYFTQLISILRDNTTKNPQLEISHAYVAEIIDRLM